MRENKTIWDLATPALLLDGPAAERNIQKAAAFVKDKSLRLRPHFKNHKCVTIAKRQLAAGGCVGITAAKLAEAEILVAQGVENVLIANQVVGPTKVVRLIDLCQRATVRVAIDSLENATAISQAAAQQGLKAGVLLEVDIGMGRCGVPPGVPAVRMAERIAELPGLRFDGIQAYEGHIMDIMDTAERTAAVRSTLPLALDTRRQIEAAGLPVRILSSAGTGTYRVTGSLPGVDELQLGSYVLMDWVYHERVDGEFEIALSVLATVISSFPERFVVDVGQKGVGHDMGPPRVKVGLDSPDPQVLSEKQCELHVEHCIVRAPGHRLRVGDKVKVIPSRCDTTSHLHRQLVVHDAERVLDTWPIEAAGALT